MLELIVELAPELAALGFYGLGTLALSALGVVLEEVGLGFVSSGQPKLGAWVMFMGLMAFYFGLYAMGYNDFLPRLRALRARLAAN